MSQQPPSSYDPEDEQEPRDGISLVQRPPPYPLEEAIESAHAPEPIILPHSEPEPWDAPQRADQRASARQSETSEGATQRATVQPATPATGQQSATATGQPRTATAQPLQVVAESNRETLSPAPACDGPPDRPPESLSQRLEGLPQWQARYVLALYELGGITGLACSRCKVSRESVEQYQASNPAFAAACAAAAAHRTDLVIASTFRGATVGDLRAKFHQGVIVGYERVRDTRAAELILKLDGKLEDGGNKGPASVALVQVTHQTDVAGVVAETMAKLFAARAAQKRVTDV